MLLGSYRITKVDKSHDAMPSVLQKLQSTGESGLQVRRSIAVDVSLKTDCGCKDQVFLYFKFVRKRHMNLWSYASIAPSTDGQLHMVGK